MDLSIVITSYNTSDILLKCLDSIWLETKDITFEVIVVDNASVDDTVTELKKLSQKRKNLKTIFNNENVGFSKGNNQGVAKSKGNYILFLNSDTRLIENTFKKMIDWMESHKDIGVSSCQLLNSDKSLQASGGYFPDILKVFFWTFLIDDLPFINSFGSYHPHVGDFYRKDHEQDWVTGAFMMVRREVIEKVKGFDENIFMYAEELELCYRIKKLGYKIYYTTVSKIIHIGGASSGSRNALLGEFKGLKYFYKKHKSHLEQFLLAILLKIGSLVRLVIFNFVPSKRGVASIYAEAFINS